MFVSFEMIAIVGTGIFLAALLIGMEIRSESRFIKMMCRLKLKEPCQHCGKRRPDPDAPIFAQPELKP